jgi:hypothetical protein
LLVVNFIKLGQGANQLYHAVGKEQDGFVDQLVAVQVKAKTGFVQIFHLDKSIPEVVNLGERADERGHFE